ncbi:FAD/NAD(P)-binding domain-containing protein [Exidia glandulosa HHB12029]|uniref:FAD/NAD(P)-binding domain-containing protein n=1 Tax=Exidia glandulosa HHB12029 TaxID=1314781 RepID=A0A165NG76_EXIGL|nr:FAD/NAD(P)-binding domain-containing protein [Exidia glandulosa HHB12029]
MSVPSSNPQTKDFRVAIVGGGIGGLFCAISLRKSGVPFDIFEAAAQFGEVGAGIGFAPNSEAAMRYLGIFEDYMRVANHRDRYSVILGNETHDHVADMLPHGGPVTSIHRAHLLDVLLKHVPSESSHLKKRCERVEQVSADPPLYRIHFHDGTTHEANLVIGADGIRSVVRDSVLGYRVEPRYVGTRAYRGIFPAQEWLKTIGPENETSLLIVSGLGKIDLVGFVSEPLERRFSEGTDILPPGEPWVQPANKEQALADFVDMPGPFVKTALNSIERMTVWKIHCLWPPLPTYVKDGIALLGDAAHGTTPHCGQGAGQALEDSYILGQLLGHPKTTLQTLRSTLAIYDEIRRPRGNKVVEYSLETGNVWEGWGANGESVEGRKLDAEGRLDWIWQHDINQDAERAIAILEA